MASGSLGERIRTIRTKKGLTLEEFGKYILNANKSIVSKWENNQTTPNNERLVKIAEIGNVPIEYLLNGDPYALMSSEEIKEMLNAQDYFGSLEEYKKLEYPDIKNILNEKEVYYDKKQLNKDDKVMAENILDTLFKDLEVNYPSQERIEKEYDKKIKTLEILKKRIKRKNNKEGE